MAGDTNSNIFINIDTSQAMTQLRLLEKELTALNRSLIVGTKAAAAAQAKYAQSLLHNVNATGQWSASMTRMSTASEQFANNLDRQRLSLKEYFRYGMASTKTFGKMFGSEFDTLGKLVDKRVKTLQQQYVQLGRDAQGAMNAMKFTPKSLNMSNLTTQLMMATQKQQILNKLIDDGSTKLLNFGKNTQWAGRQLMVGFTIPLMLFGAQAIKTFKEIETQVIRFKKVYGDIFTDQGATDAALKNIRDLADEYTKYGLKVSDTIKTAADAAAAGFSGKGLENLVEQTNKLAVLGGVTQEKALETTIALKNAFQIDTGAMAGTIDFLNAVENQTVVALEDLTEAIPKVAPVIQQLGGDVKDLAYFMAAMQEGGISAAQGANALKSGLASLINPSNAASKAAAAVGINIKGIVEANAGNLRNTVTGFAQALQPLTDLERSRVIEKVFGKYQFARISALLNNLGREGTQAARVLQLTNASVEELAILSQRELKIQADSPMNKLAGSVERLKKSIAPIGELFAKVFTPIIEFITRMADKFNNLPEGIKKAIGVITLVVGGLGPVFLMTFGLLANAVANSVKGLQVLRKGYQQLAAGSTDAALKTQYLSQEELENISISNALYSKHQQLSAAYTLESAALTSLMSTYTKATAAMGSFAATNPGMFMPRGGVLLPKKFAGGTTSVPGPKGAGDVIPAMLSPGESVIPVEQTQKYAGFINQIIQDKVPGFAGGLFPAFGAAANVGKVASTRGVVGPKAPVIPIGATRELKSLFGNRAGSLSNILYREQGDDLVIQVRDASFIIPKTLKKDLKIALQKNERYLTTGDEKRTSKYGGISRRKGNTWENTTEGKLHYILKNRAPELNGARITDLSSLYGRLQKFDMKKNRVGKQSIADKRMATLIASKNPHAQKLMNYYGTEEKAFLQARLEQLKPGSTRELNWDKMDTPSHLFPAGKKRGKAAWSPEKIARDWSFANLGLRGVNVNGIKGAHPRNADEAMQIIAQLEGKPNISTSELALREALKYRVSRNPSYYDDFRFTDDAMMSPIPLAGGVVSLGMPIPFKKVQASRMMAEKIDAHIKESRFKNLPVTDTGTKIQKLGGFSVGSISRAVNGVYQLPNGRTVVYKAVESEEAALAEMRMSALMRKGSELGTPSNQSIKVIADPTDLSKQRKVLVIESDYDPRFVNPTGDFTPKQFIKQTLASGIRGDKDLKTDNVSGNDVVDMSNAGVFATASNRTKYADKMKSVEEQLLINFGAVKGGASKDFAKSVQALAAEMGPTKFKNLMLKEIEESIPRYKATIETFKLNPQEREMYDAIVARLEDAKKADWKKIYNAAVGDIPAYADGIVSVPGPKGAGDIQPAMLSPGEAVIPAKQSEKYMPLIRSMIADNVPGYAGSNIEWDGSPSSLRPGGKYSGPVTPPGVDSWGDPIRPPATSKQRLRNALTSVVRDKDINAMKNLTKETTRAAKETKVAGKVMEGVKKAGSRVAASLLDTEKAASGTTDALGKDKTRGFRGFLGGYGNVSQTVTNDDGTTRAATAAERTNARQMNRMNFTQKMMPMQMAGMMVPMVAQGYATKNPDSGIAKNMDAIMMLSMLTMLLPMLNSPLKLLAATAVGLTVIFKMQAATIKKNVIEGQKQAESMSMTTKNLEELGKITQKVSITQTAAAKRAGRNTDLSPVSIEFGKNLIDSSEFGKNLKASFEGALANPNLGEGAAVNSLVTQLGTAVSQGVLSVDQAESIAVALTRNLKDAKLELNVRGRLIQLLGPNGENILNNPLQVQLELISSGQKLQDAAITNLNKVASQQVGVNTKGEVGQLVAGGIGGLALGGRAGIQAARMVQGGTNAASLLSQEAAISRASGAGKVKTALSVVRNVRTAGMIGSAGLGATGVGAPAAAVGATITAVITGGIEAAIRNYQKGKEKAAIGKAAGLLQGTVSQNVAASQASIDALTSQYDSAIANLELKKKTLKAEQDRKAIDDQIAELEYKKQTGLKTLRSQQAKLVGSASSNLDKVSGPSAFENFSPFGSGRGQVKDKYMEAFKVGMEDKFKDNAALKAQATLLQSQLESLKIKDDGTGDKRDKVTLEISTLVTSDVLTPAEASTLVSTLTKTDGDLQKNLETLITVQGTEGVQRLSTILTMLPNENNQKQLVLAVKNMDKSEADATLSAIEELGKVPDFVGIELSIETQKNDIKELKERGKEIDSLRKKFPNGQLSLKALIKAQQEAGGEGKNLTLDSAIRDWERLSKLPKDLQFQAMITMGSIEFSDSFDAILDRELKTAFQKQAKGAKTGRLAAERLQAFMKDPKNIASATKAAMDKIRTQIFGEAPVDDSKKGGPTDTEDDGPKRDESFLNDLAQRLKLVKEGGFNALTPLKSLREFLKDGGKQSINPGLDAQAGAIKQIEAAAKTAGISIDKDFMEIIRGLDADQFVLWSKTLFDIGKNGRITGLKEDFITINEGFRKATIAGYIQDVKDANKEIENQIVAHKVLTDEGYNSIEIQKILQDATLTAKIAAQGGLKATKEEQAELNKEIQKTINLNYQLSMTKLNDNIKDTEMQVEAFKRLSAAGVKHEVILEILKDKSNVWAIGSADATVDIKDKFGDLINKTKQYSDQLELIRKQTLTFEQASQEAIDANIAALDLQARQLQNQFDIDNFELKAKIKLAEDAVENVNKQIQAEQDKIDDINFTLKYDKEIGQNLLDDLQEEINDAQRKIEFDFDRPIQALQDRSTILSNDLTLIDKAAEEINEKYDKQEEALTKISQLNSDIATQEKNRISLADALSQGDISAAAQMAQEMRTSAAEAASRRSAELLAAGRATEIDNLRSISGMTKAQIQAEQFRIEQQIFALEQQSKVAKQAIVAIEDRIYNITELREAKLLEIRNIEQTIDNLKNNQLRSAQKNLESLQAELDANQAILDAQLAKIDKQKLSWESIQIKLEAYRQKLKSITDGELKSMLDMVNSIAAAMSGLGNSSASSAFVSGDSYTPPPDTAASLAEFEKFLKIVEELDAAQAAYDNAIALDYPHARISQLLDRLLAAQAAYDATLPKGNINTSGGSGGAGGGRFDMQYMSYGGKVKPMQYGGRIGSDYVPAMLSPGEFVMNKTASKAFGPMLAAMNGSKFPSMLGRVGQSSYGSMPSPISTNFNAQSYPQMSSTSINPMTTMSSANVNNNSTAVYNYSVGINVGGSNANPQDIARAVMTEIKNVDAQRIRSQRA